VTRTSQIKDVTIKEGRSGAMCFVTVRHSWATERGPALEERQDRTSSIAPQMRPVARLPSAPRSRCGSVTSSAFTVLYLPPRSSRTQ
jgi:3-methylfumaryl-CoA hydratase